MAWGQWFLKILTRDVWDRPWIKDTFHLYHNSAQVWLLQTSFHWYIQKTHPTRVLFLNWTSTLIFNPDRYCCTSLLSNNCSMVCATDAKVLVLSKITSTGIPLLDVNLLKHHRNVWAVKSGTDHNMYAMWSKLYCCLFHCPPWCKVDWQSQLHSMQTEVILSHDIQEMAELLLCREVLQAFDMYCTDGLASVQTAYPWQTSTGNGCLLACLSHHCVRFAHVTSWQSKQ